MLNGTFSWSDRIEFHHINNVNDSRIEAHIIASDLVTNWGFIFLTITHDILFLF